jgi:hypothetical protein
VTSKIRGDDGNLIEPSILREGESWDFFRVFHIELFRGGMNRLLLRSWATDNEPLRLEVLFMNVKRLCVPTAFDGLLIRGSTAGKRLDVRFADETAVQRFELVSQGETSWVVAGSVGYIEEKADPWEPSSFFLM